MMSGKEDLPADSNSEKAFYKSLFVLVWPITLQNFISAAVGSADVIMLGYVGQTALAAVSLASQIQFILFLFFTGLSSGVTMLAAQYWGKRDTESIETIAGIALKLSCAVAAVFACAACFFSRTLMYIFTDEKDLIESGAQYLRIIGISYFIMAISQVYQSVMKSIERVRIVTAITFAALFLNILLNAVFIFGLFGAPRLGIRGVAIATVIARIIELLLCLADSLRVGSVRFSLKLMIRRNPVLSRDFFHFSFPALGNEFVWGAAFAMYSVILGHMGQDIVAANSVVTVARNLAGVFCFGMAYGGAILLGKQMGTGSLAEAKRNAARLCKATIGAGVFGGCIIFLIRPLMFHMAELTPIAHHYLDIMLYVNCVYIVGQAINTVIICGVFRSGGDAQFGFICDSIIMWLVSVPLGLLSAFVFKLPPLAVYCILCLDEFEKMPFVIAHYKGGKWAQNITRDFTTKQP